jgi:hypothetical protein
MTRAPAELPTLSSSLPLVFDFFDGGMIRSLVFFAICKTSESAATMSDHSLIVRTTLEVGRLSPPEIFICFRINSS